MIEIKRILVGYDGSEPAAHAVRAAAAYAQAYSADLTVLTAADRLIRPDGHKTLAADENEAHETANHGAHLAGEAGAADPRTVVSLLAPANALAQEAVNGGYDLVVVGHRGVSGLRSLLMGSVAKSVVEKVHCSVLVVR